ncbi:ATP-binding cassette domain-containing protein [Faecalicatena sp. AGMB00832]|uniref:ATP-binding cassette domain-containing protein n=1 Tax=Faecalicatena faecalis TaxID=2726362 RepID=A0ABS6CYK8_9FIRM|nr:MULTISPECIES: ABC-F family ATP-binding cassette domain-containing protein [Faecalicatena]MBU3874343.1 ATP-binding cassette domain-containing protein [Faecalicatena faecalis]MCI6464501.1 ATP-binding cassette domain-containing protein [Faecalicatena sp.]MDY5619063.1 ABC-F family ATP-binding cassette domain-containing protein [Lachnospiraceae bacterium]
MSILNVEHLSYGFGDRAIFQDVSFRLLRGEHIGLIGANGEGKSTFFNIVTGKLTPDEGKVEWAKDVRVGYLDQHTVLKKGMSIRDVLKSAFSYLFELEQKMNAICDRLGEVDEETMMQLMEELGTIQDTLTLHDFYIIDAKVEEVARALGLLDLGLDKDVTDLSGGQRTRILLGKLLLEKPDILLLDEPTNYLDEEHINWLKRYLIEYENAFILISHDIPFLDEVVNIIYHMENQELNRYVGNYEDFQRVYEVKKSQLEAAYKRQQQEISQLKDFVARNKARVSTRNMAMSRQKKLDKMDVIELAAERPKPEFHFKKGRTPGRYIFETKDFVIGYDEPLSKPLNISLERGQKIALTGANGIGKTTLIRSIMGLVEPISGKCELGENLAIGYFEQEMKGENKSTCIEEIWSEFPSFTQYEVRSALAKCGLTTKHIESQVRVLSGGEQAKVRLCKLINKETNVLMLDEPTNHLDVDAKDALKKALQEYQGTLLLICHEPEFYQDIVQEVWDCSKWTTKLV